MAVRQAAVAGTWYPGSAGALGREIDEYVGAAAVRPSSTVRAIIAPHAGLLFSGPVGAWAYKAASGGDYDVAFVVGPSHFVGFDGVAVWPSGGFETPLGLAPVDAAAASSLLSRPVARELPAAHVREHSLEMQLPFLRRLLPDVPIVPVVIGYQTADTIEQLADALVQASDGRRPLLVASTDLSHYFDAATAAVLDGRVQACVERFEARGLLALFQSYPEAERGRHVACGGGAAIAVMLAARRLDACRGRVLRYAHSGDVSGDLDAVVGYLAAAFESDDRAA